MYIYIYIHNMYIYGDLTTLSPTTISELEGCLKL